MKFDSSIKNSFFRIAFLVGIYALFFLVELRYNFDTNLFVYPSSKTPSYHSLIKYNKPPAQVKINLRLNKRFHPSFISAEVGASKEVLVEHKDQKFANNYSRVSLFNIFLLTKSLRAPPLV
jgi:hypothetical protein